MLCEGVRWFDDWFAIEDVAPGVIAIGEPRFHQNNWNYLICGTRRALLFDTGPGVRDISNAVRALTNLPVTALPSHMHFDHTGCLSRFTNIAVPDLPILREGEKDGWFTPRDDLYVGYWEGMSWTPVRVNSWLPIGSKIDLGGRVLELLHTPGHSPDSVSLLDREANIMFAADFVYPGKLYAQIRNSDLKAYLESAEALLPLIGEDTAILCAHGKPDANRLNRAPRLARKDVADLASSLTRLKASGEKPAAWPVNERMSLLVSEEAFASWQATP
ncbi:MBL fold metallo-hydrolase [Aestuariivirga sp.]|uniref:MBL fold metallo-hydrolase n=1 Tax=Aestuariivirga sp. TaxID=2650926 RepID=UPI003594016B